MKEQDYKELAKEWVRKFKIKDSAGFQQVSNVYIKQCAIICLEAIIEANPTKVWIDYDGDKRSSSFNIEHYQRILTEVKKWKQTESHSTE